MSVYVLCRTSISGRLTIAIPTVQRPNKNYFPSMLREMFMKTADEELREITFVILLADIGTTEWKTKLESEIKTNYSAYIEDGSLKIIQAPPEYYDTMLTFKDDRYVNWRTKQNFDYSYIMRYCQHMSDYYMQMEDDVTPVDGYYQAITHFISSQPDDNWVCLEFSTLGFIGKLYHTPEVVLLADMLLIFNYSQPVDFIFPYYNMMTGRRSQMRKPSLFQHRGYYSSLRDKIQPLQDKFFDFPPKQFHGDNPFAFLETNLKYTADFPPSLAYSKDPGFFWSAESVESDSNFTIVFNSTHNLSKIQITTGSQSHPSDTARFAILEASEAPKDRTSKCGQFNHIASFKNGEISVDKERIVSSVGKMPLKCLQIRFLERQVEWLIIREIAVFIDK